MPENCGQGAFNAWVIKALEKFAHNQALEKTNARELKYCLDRVPVDKLESDRYPKKRIPGYIDKERLIPPPVTHRPKEEEISSAAAKEFQLIYQNKPPVGVRPGGVDELPLRSLLTAIRAVAQGAGLGERGVIELLRRGAHKSLLNVIENHVKADGSLESLWWAIQMMAAKTRTPTEAARELANLLNQPVSNATSFAYEVLGLCMDKCGVLNGERKTLQGYLLAVQTLIMHLHQHLPAMAAEEEEVLQAADALVHENNLQAARKGFHTMLRLMYTYDDQINVATSSLGQGPFYPEKLGQQEQAHRGPTPRRQKPLHEVTVDAGEEMVEEVPKTSAPSTSLNQTEQMFKEYLSFANNELVSTTKKALKGLVQEIRSQAVTSFQPVEARARERNMPNEMNLRDERMAQSPRFRDNVRGYQNQRNFPRGNYPPREYGFRYGRTFPDGGDREEYQPQQRGVAGGRQDFWGQRDSQGQEPRLRACHLCASTDHLWRNCLKFRGQIPQGDYCPSCLRDGVRLRHLDCAGEAHMEVATVEKKKSSSPTNAPRRPWKPQAGPSKRRPAARAR